MTITYALSIYIFNIAQEHTHPSYIHAFQIVLKLFYHWIYTSQYLKTCMLLPSMVKKMHLLMESYHKTQENQFEVVKINSSFLIKHEGIDFAIQKEKRRIKIISRNFQIVDAVVGATLLASFMLLTMKLNSIKFENPNQAFGPFEWVFALVFGISLAVSASYLSKSVKQATGQKQNTCLLLWHTVNVLLIAAVFMAIAIL